MSLSTRRTEFGSPGHLAARFAGSLWPAGPGIAAEAWARRWLKPGEADIWKAMNGPDRRHGVLVARRVATALGNADGAGVPTNALAAALLHDAGKSESDVGVIGRSVVTLLGLAIGRRRMASWRYRKSGWLGRAGRYAAHDEIGAETLAAVGSDELVVAWAREHHLPEEQWSVDGQIGKVLKAADDD